MNALIRGRDTGSRHAQVHRMRHRVTFRGTVAVAAREAAYAADGWGIRPNCLSSETWS